MWYIWLPIGLIVGAGVVFGLMNFLPSSKVKNINNKAKRIDFENLSSLK